jgi:hypothetical protein
MKFSGKNLTALEKEIKDMMAKASSSVDDAVQKKKLLEAEGGTVKSTLLKAGEGFIRTITPIRKSASGDVLWLKTGFTGMMEVSMIFLLYKFTNVLLSTDSPTAATVTVVKNEISSGIAAATGVENASNNTSGKFGNSIPELRSFIKSLSASYTQDMVDGLAIKSQGGGKYEVTLPGGSKVFTHNGTTFTF